MKTPRAVANFDSASVMLGATAAALRGESFPGLGALPSSAVVAAAVNVLPSGLRETIYRWGGWREGMPAAKPGRVRVEELARWAVDQYQRRPYPAVALGSASGAIVHLCAALGIPWLPQTLLIPVRRARVDPDDALRAMAVGIEPARALLGANPELQVHHMHDPNHERPMIPGSRRGFVRSRRNRARGRSRQVGPGPRRPPARPPSPAPARRHRSPARTDSGSAARRATRHEHGR